MVFAPSWDAYALHRIQGSEGVIMPFSTPLNKVRHACGNLFNSITMGKE